jgi:4-oxalocrotonate tautomerase
MPTFHIELFEGRTLEQKREFIQAVTKATCESLGVEPNSVEIILTHVKRENWATGGKLWSEAWGKRVRATGGRTPTPRHSSAGGS